MRWAGQGGFAESNKRGTSMQYRLATSRIIASSFVKTILAVFTIIGAGYSQISRDGAPQFESQLDHQASITVSVRSTDGKPLRDARVEVREMSTGSIAGATYTNSSGYADLTVPTGNYEVLVTHGLSEAREDVIAQSFSNAVSISMPAAKAPPDGSADTVSVSQLKVPGKARKEYKKAQELVSKRRLEEASQHIAKALAIYPNYADALTLRGLLRLDGGEVDQALNDFQQAINVDPYYAQAYIAAGATYNMEGKYEDALRSLDRGVSLAPTAWQAYFEMGKAQIGRQNYQIGINLLDRASSLAPGFTLVHLVKAHALLAMKEYGPAMDELQAFLSKSPQDPEAGRARSMLEQAKSFASAK